jgi:5'-3' exonuclease
MTSDSYDVLVVDGSNLAFRASVLHLESETENTSVIWGVLNILRSFLTKHFFKEVCVAWDGKKYKEEKRKVYPEYKKNRPEPDAADQSIRIEIRRQINELQKVLPALGIKQLQRDELEADDVIGILCEGLEDKTILVVSGDRDLFQLVSKNITIYYPSKEVFITPDNFEQEVGVSLDNFIFYKTIIGDPGDNIKGLKGFGDVTAKKLLTAYGPWTEWFEGGHPNHLTPVREEILQSLKKNQKQVLSEAASLGILVRNYTLMSVGWLDIESKDDLMGEYNKQVPAFDEEVVKSYFLDKQFNKTLARFNGWVLPFLELARRGLSDN